MYTIYVPMLSLYIFQIKDKSKNIWVTGLAYLYFVGIRVDELVRSVKGFQSLPLASHLFLTTISVAYFHRFWVTLMKPSADKSFSH